ncbi:putative uncharacterized protein YDL057W isoform X1 [Nicotiana sylvestris]|uniref:Serine aminopeptidase S33 domain-containing protein n=1 Tax=Nicotiana sylvestris TaxID=4096 RepID=A0A1U7YI15_NICSY|nr:PREDICTED: putative uncharacterized protein YDL057W [Nicotiana sylvestris]XP_016477139.1 PREDICTED: putative uncharacterized protein YDL057W isoform X1 [Nicotiana tabacum]
MAKFPSIPHVQETGHRRVTVHSSHGEELVGVLHETNSLELVIICHGFKSSKDRIPMANLAAALEKEGISAFRFDFAGNGESEGSFQYGNYRREADDLRAVVEHFHEEKRFIAAIVGHSKGGNAVLLYASRYKDVQTVINISGRFNLERGIEGRLGRDFKEKIKQDGFIDVINRKGRLEYRVTEESLMDRLTTDTRGACLSIPQSCRVLTIHGTMDEMVPVEDAMEFAKNVPNHKLHIIEGADHEFTMHQDELASLVVAFVKEGLCGDYMALPSESCKRTSGYIHSRF